MLLGQVPCFRHVHRMMISFHWLILEKLIIFFSLGVCSILDLPSFWKVRMKTESEVYVSENDEQGSLNKILNGDISERSENLKFAAEG